MTRSVNKGIFVCSNLLATVIKELKKCKTKDEIKTIKTNSRSCVIIEEFVGLTFAVHNGKGYVPIHITEGMVTHRLGEFVPTRKIPVHPKIVKNKNVKKGRV